MRVIITASFVLLASTLCFGQALPAADTPDQVRIVSGSHPDLPILPRLGSKHLSKYTIPAQEFEIRFGPTTEVNGVLVQPVTFPSPVTRRWATIHGTYYRPKAASPSARVPASVVVHHLGGYKPEETLAQRVAEEGMAAFTIMLPNYGKRHEPGTPRGFLQADPFGVFMTFEQAVKDVIRASDFLRSRPEVDGSQVGAVGVSLGAIVSSIAKGVDPRMRRTVLVLGGGNLGTLVTKFGGFDTFFGGADKLDAFLRPMVEPIDPTTFASRVHPSDVLMLNATKDEIVPRESTDALWESFGRPHIRWFECGHEGLIEHLPEVIKETLSFLKGRSPI